MMITPEYCVTMARYNGWQNRQLKALFDQMSPDELTQDRKSFFGSILNTANHLLWGDRIWIARLTGGTAPAGSIADSTGLTQDATAWGVERFRTDGALLRWAERVLAVELTGPLSWYSGVQGRAVEKPLALCVSHMFNHQTHHRGQIHAMLTAAGYEAPVSDLIFMPDDGPWI
ncbi:DinB family protein [Primorskyibacter sp. 2E107]|uniref:DinB family protein n=1 Tax=Primorskyibacter sp. 2E107 TaxID=3403458 RepID=UPI003AF93E9A